jgi:hypothetical protein
LVTAIFGLVTSCSDATKEKRTTSATQNEESEQYQIQTAENMVFNLLAPEASEKEASGDEEAHHGEAGEDTAMPEPSDDDSPAVKPPVVPPMNSKSISLICNAKSENNSRTEFILELFSSRGEREIARITNCGRGVKISITGLKAGIEYKIAAHYSVNGRLLFSGATEVFTIKSGYIKLVLRKIKTPAPLPQPGVGVDVIWEDEDTSTSCNEDKVANLICRAHAAPKMTPCPINKECPVAAAIPLEDVKATSECEAKSLFEKQLAKMGIPLSKIDLRMKCEAQTMPRPEPPVPTEKCEIVVSRGQVPMLGQGLTLEILASSRATQAYVQTSLGESFRLVAPFKPIKVRVTENLIINAEVEVPGGNVKCATTILPKK